MSCRSCVQIERIQKNPSIVSKFIEMANNGKGKNNPFFGKRHTNETKDVIRNKAALNSKGKKNPMYGKNLYDVWLKKYGKVRADERMDQYRRTQSKGTSGNKNPMYGKPAPKGSGNGWSGWYSGHFFRSLRELAFMLAMDRFHYQWRTAERSDLCVSYEDYAEVKRTYRSDFIVEERYLVECKPKKLWKSPLVATKQKAMEAMCQKKGLKFKLIDLPIPDVGMLMSMSKSGTIRFTERCKKKFQSYCEKTLSLQDKI